MVETAALPELLDFGDSAALEWRMFGLRIGH
jgi:hypothetical protein